MDIDYCSGEGCPVRTQCRRFNQPKPKGNFYSIKPPFTTANNKFICLLYWGSQNDGIIKQLENIMKPKQPK